MKVVLVLATCGMLFTTTLSWSIAFYTGEDCNGDETFNNAIHTGSGSSACIAAGAPTADVECSWYSNGGQSEENCTAAMNPQPKSLKFAQTGSCAVSWYGCESPNWPTWTQPEANECFALKKIQGKTGPEISFECWDV